MTKPKTAQPDTRRRRASTGAMMDRIMGLARRLPLTRQVLAEQLETATPAQMEFMHAWMNAEIESRERSKRARLLKQAGFPQSKELDGYDWTPLRFPVDYGRQALESLDFVEHTQDVVMFGPPGTGKTHLAIALGRRPSPPRTPPNSSAASTTSRTGSRRWPRHARAASRRGSAPTWHTWTGHSRESRASHRKTTTKHQPTPTRISRSPPVRHQSQFRAHFQMRHLDIFIIPDKNICSY